MAAETNPERLRLEEAKARTQAWRKWGPYVSERQWGTVREDYSADGDAWGYFPHEHARQPRLSLGRGRHRRDLRQQAASLHRLALWNGKDPILKERLFGLTNRRRQSRRGRQGALLLPRCDADLQLREHALQISAGGISLRASGRGERAAHAPADPSSRSSTPASSTTTVTSTSISNMPKPPTDDILMQVTVSNRGPDPAEIHVLPQLWFRNTWSGFDEGRKSRPWSWSARTILVASRQARRAYRPLRARRPDPLLRQRDQSAQALSASNVRMATSRTAFTNM